MSAGLSLVSTHDQASRCFEVFNVRFKHGSRHANASYEMISVDYRCTKNYQSGECFRDTAASNNLFAHLVSCFCTSSAHGCYNKLKLKIFINQEARHEAEHQSERFINRRISRRVRCVWRLRAPGCGTSHVPRPLSTSTPWAGVVRHHCFRRRAASFGARDGFGPGRVQ